MSQSESSHDPADAQRRRMIDEQIRARGIRDERVLGAMLRIPRERFVPADVRDAAYEDRALPVGGGQTISQPYIVAYMTEQLEVTPQTRLLEIGTGTGYQTAVLAMLAGHVYTIERIDGLFRLATSVLADLGCRNVTARLGDGSQGWPEAAPFDRILVTAGAPKVPPRLVEQLTDDGIMVVPVGGATEQTIVRVTRHAGQAIETPLLACRFVRLIGEEAWPESAE